MISLLDYFELVDLFFNLISLWTSSELTSKVLNFIFEEMYLDLFFRLSQQMGKIEIVKYMIETRNRPVNGHNEDGESHLFVVVCNNHWDILKYFVEEKQANVNIANHSDGHTPLIFTAMFADKLDLMKYLVEKGADVNQAEFFDSQTPLFVSSSKGHLELVKYLIANGADPGKRNLNGEDCLWIAASSGRLEIVKFLIEQNLSDVNVTNNNSETPIYTASLQGKLEIVRYLFEKGADITIKTRSFDETPMIAAKRKKHEAILKFFKEKGIKDN